MSDYCRQCSVAMFGEDTRDMADISCSGDTADRLYARVLCECCGPTQVDHEGTCVHHRRDDPQHSHCRCWSSGEVSA